MTRKALLAAVTIVAMASGVSRAATFAEFAPAPATGNALSGGNAMGVISISKISTVKPNQASPGAGFADPSPAVGVDSVVPEPAAWAMLLLGLGGIGASLRGRQRRLPVHA